MLKDTMGLWMATALVIGNMIGSGVFLLPSSRAGAAGPLSMVAWVSTSVGALLLAYCFARLGGAFPRTGGPYAYARRAFGDFIGFQTAWGYWIAAWAGNAAITVAFVGYLSVFWTQLGDGNHNLLAALVGMGVIWFLTAVNSLGVREGAQVQVVTTVLKFVPLAIIGVVGLFFIDGAGKDIIAKGFVLPLAGIPIYVALKWYQARQAAKGAEAMVELGPEPVPTNGAPVGDVPTIAGSR
jgi:APA family basic amino acid/polyamine antiporter